MRLVIGKNVLVSALHLPGGTSEMVYRLGLEGRVELVTSRALLAELARVLTDKFDWDDDRVDRVVAQVARTATVVEPTESVTVIKADPADDRVLEAALAGNAPTIVS